MERGRREGVGREGSRGKIHNSIKTTFKIDRTAAFPVVLGSNPSTHLTAYNHL